MNTRRYNLGTSSLWNLLGGVKAAKEVCLERSEGELEVYVEGQPKKNGVNLLLSSGKARKQ